MTTPSDSEGSAGEFAGDAPYLPPARPVAPVSDRSATAVPTLPPTTPPTTPPTPLTAPPPAAPADAPFVPSAPPSAAPAAPAPPPAFDAKAMVESQKHYNANPAYGALPAGTDESRAAARKLREQANRKRRRGRVAARIVGLLVLVGLAVGGFFVYQALSDDDDDAAPAEQAASEPVSGDEPGALTPLGEQQMVIDGLEDVSSGARPGAGALLDAVEDAREVVGQAQPPTGAPTGLLVAAVFSPAVLDHTEMLDPADGYERFVVRAAELAEVNPSARDALVQVLTGLPQVAADDPQLAVAPVVLPGDVAIAIQRDGDGITRIVAVATDPAIAAVGP